MMRFEVKCADAVDEEADALICGANVLLNLSGGVGGELLRRYGPELQKELHALIADRAGRYAVRGEVFVTHSPSVPYRAVFHAVAVDAMYQANAVVVAEMLRECLERCEREELRKVIVTALGTGFGNLTMGGFCDALGEALRAKEYEIPEVLLCIPDEELCREARERLRELCVAEEKHWSQIVGEIGLANLNRISYEQMKKDYEERFRKGKSKSDSSDTSREETKDS